MSEKRDSPPSFQEKKIIIGIPVLPGLPSFTETTIRVDEDVTSTSGTTAVHSEEGATAVPVTAPAQSQEQQQRRWNLQHVDFIPNMVKGKGEEYERFSALVDRGNEWSSQHPEALIFSCETVQWTTMDRPVYTDSSILHKSMSGDKKTRLFRGLRIWYMVMDDTFIDRKASPGPFKIGYCNYSPENKNDSFGQMLRRLNDDFFKRSVLGKRMIRMETIHQLNDCPDPDISSWSEKPENSRDYFSYYRIFFLLQQDERQKHGEIGIRDFFPQFDQRSPHSHGFETYSETFKRAARWIHQNPNLHVVNLQSVFFKYKKEDFKPTSSLYDRCFFKEHNSAYGSLSHTRTDYLQVLRMVFHHPPGSPGGKKPEVPVPIKFRYKQFAPSKLKKSEPYADDAEPLEAVYEDLRHLEEKINAWITVSNARIFGVETIPTRLMSGGQEAIGPEATLAYNDRERNISREYWRVNLRLYLQGDFRELPFTWSTRFVEEKPVAVPAPR